MGLRNLLFGAEQTDPIEELRRLFDERESTLHLEATYGLPRPDMQGEPTVVFPYTVFDGDGEPYGSGSKEFIIPDDGMAERGSALVDFLAKRHDITRENVTFDHLIAIEGTTAEASLNTEGDIVVGR
jgi:hypothetical protein